MPKETHPKKNMDMKMNDENNKLLHEYLVFCRKKGHRQQGIKGLRNRVPKLFSYLNERGLNLNEVSLKESLDYQKWIIERGRNDGEKYSNNTVRTYITAASAFYDYLVKNHLVFNNPFKDMKKIRLELKLPKNILKEKEMNLLLSELGAFDKEKGLKKRISMYKLHLTSELMYSTGLRIHEVAQLKSDDIDFDRGLVHVKGGKGGKNRVSYLNDYTSKILRLYLDIIRDLLLTEHHKTNNALFGSGYDNFQKMINRELKGICKRLKLKEITSHGFRHALGFHLLRSGCDIRYIQEILGHSRLRNTEIYTRVEKEDLKAMIDKYHPRQFMKKESRKDEKTDLPICRNNI